MVGRRVIAKIDDVASGFRKGDTLEIIRTGTHIDYEAKNLTRPDLEPERRTSIFLVEGDYDVIETEEEIK
ncbi:MAG: hypothetical protein WD512_08265, partial [Candidatus Paceibacterota bacterium]